MTELTKEAVAEAIDQLVQERGQDYVYPTEEVGGCYYSFEDGTPACLVGAVVAKLDPEAFQKLVEIEAPFDDGNGGVFRYKAGTVGTVVAHPSPALVDGELVGGSRTGLVVEDRDLFLALRDAQSTQDQGHSWGKAREAFVQRLVA
ncbi:hypothetical protein QDW23_gp51 [Microbacterium phage Stromboli]|uniref:hypothetical protein n=1 Tax=Microbacterium phage Stromboli TaxID=2713263 RepID=UPI0014172F3D|nr:hypothetical protein QDW23_gp51 [Microbacterium phage Stromboli]QIN93710.1 hypothetical protein SEA_STROMBOLI_51 [Microbacterium phage Stromboli]